jgi:NitT/TauT family transport system substrate-binding protein
MALIGVWLRAMVLGLTFVSASAAMEQANVATPSYGLTELPVVVAMRNGYFRSERLEIQKIQIEPEVAVKALLAGEVSFNLAWEASVRAATSGAPVKVIAALVSRPLHVLMSRPEIRSGRELRGKTLGIDAFSSTIDYLSRVAVRYLGVEPDTNVGFVEIGNGALRLAALKAGEVHAAALDIIGAVKAEEQGLKRLVQFGDIIDYPVLGVAVAGTQLVKHREQTKKFIRALMRGARFIKQDRSETIRIIERYLKITPSQATKSYDSAFRYFTEDGLISDRVLAFAVRRAREELQFAGEPALGQVADWSIAREIMAERRKIPFWLRQYDP